MKPDKKRARADRSTVDWGSVHGRLEAARNALERGGARGPEEVKQILKLRAQALAREPKGAQAPEDSIEVIEFVLAYEKYAVESSFVREVHPLKDLTPVPCTPGYVRGIVNVRGQVLSIVDVKRFFDLPEKGLPDLNKVIILRSDSMEFGILADLIVGTRIVSMDELQASLPTLTGIRGEYLKGVTADRVVVLDGEKLLSDTKIVVHEHVNKF
jgi:purine-binding chemotaxis protein CheW